MVKSNGRKQPVGSHHSHSPREILLRDLYVRQKMMERNVVLLLLFDKNGRFLLQHRDFTAPTYPDFWGFFGGGIEKGESPYEAFIRESFEELRFSPVSTQPVIVLDYDDPTTGKTGTKFYYSEECKNIDLLELHEGDRMNWFNLEQLNMIKTTEMNRIVIREITKKRTKPAAGG